MSYDPNNEMIDNDDSSCALLSLSNKPRGKFELDLMDDRTISNDLTSEIILRCRALNSSELRALHLKEKYVRSKKIKKLIQNVKKLKYPKFLNCSPRAKLNTFYNSPLIF